MVRCADRDDVHFVTKLVQHFAEVLILLCVFELAALFGQRLIVDITQANDRNTVFCNVAGVAATLAANANAGCRGRL